MEGAFSDLVIQIVSPAEGITLLLKSPVKERPAIWTAETPHPRPVLRRYDTTVLEASGACEAPGCTAGHRTKRLGPGGLTDWGSSPDPAPPGALGSPSEGPRTPASAAGEAPLGGGPRDRVPRTPAALEEEPVVGLG